MANASAPHPALVPLVKAVLREWPNLAIDAHRLKSYFYGPNREVIPATQYVTTLYEKGGGVVGASITLTVLVDKDKNVVSGPDAFLGTRKLVGSPIGTAQPQDPRKVLSLVMGALADAMQPPEKVVDAELVKIVRETAKSYAFRKDTIDVTVTPTEIRVSWWGEAGDDPAGYRPGYDEIDPADYRMDMKDRAQIHDDFLDDLRQEVQRSPYASAVQSVESVYGIPDDGERYTFRVRKKSRTASFQGMVRRVASRYVLARVLRASLLDR